MVRSRMSFHAKRELLAQVAPRYRCFNYPTNPPLSGAAILHIRVNIGP